MLVLKECDPKTTPIPHFTLRQEDVEELLWMGHKEPIQEIVEKSFRESEETFIGYDDQTGEVLGVGGLGVNHHGEPYTVPWMLCSPALHRQYGRQLFRQAKAIVARWRKKYPYRMLNVCLDRVADTKTLVKHLGFEFQTTPMKGVVAFILEPEED